MCQAVGWAQGLSLKRFATLEDLDDVILEPHPAADGIVVYQNPDFLRNAADIEGPVEFRPAPGRGLLNRVCLSCWHGSVPLWTAIRDSLAFHHWPMGRSRSRRPGRPHKSIPTESQVSRGWIIGRSSLGRAYRHGARALLSWSKDRLP